MCVCLVWYHLFVLLFLKSGETRMEPLRLIILQMGFVDLLFLELDVMLYPTIFQGPRSLSIFSNVTLLLLRKRSSLVTESNLKSTLNMKQTMEVLLEFLIAEIFLLFKLVCLVLNEKSIAIGEQKLF